MKKYLFLILVLVSICQADLCLQMDDIEHDKKGMVVKHGNFVYMERKSTYMPGDNLKMYNGISSEECLQKCNNNTKCLAFVFYN